MSKPPMRKSFLTGRESWWGLAVLGVAFFLVIATFRADPPGLDAERRQAERELEMLASSFRRCRSLGQPAETTRDLLDRDPDLRSIFGRDAKDPWGGPYTLEALADGRHLIISFGPDKMEDSEDDLRVIIEPRAR